MAKRRSTPRRAKKVVTKGIVHIQSTFNNTVTAVTDRLVMPILVQLWSKRI